MQSSCRAGSFPSVFLMMFIIVFVLGHCLWFLKRPEGRIHGSEAPQAVLSSRSFLPWTYPSILNGAWMLGSLCPCLHDTENKSLSLPAWELLQKAGWPPVWETVPRTSLTSSWHRAGHLFRPVFGQFCVLQGQALSTGQGQLEPVEQTCGWINEKPMTRIL